MKANGITCLDYTEDASSVRFVLECSAEQALAMDTTQVDVTTDDGDLAARFVALVKVSATVSAADGKCTLLCAVSTNDFVPMIESILARISAVEQKADAADQIQAQLDALAGIGGTEDE